MKSRPRTETMLDKPTHASAPKARYIMVGGFLGAGKTTAIARLARHLTDQGRRVGLITNDQGERLVDTAMLASRGYPVEEIAGGCFCCRFHSLTEAAERLAAGNRPEVFIAEPVGSCTDLVATVSYPLRRMYGESYAIAPFSVLIDPIRALRMFGLREGSRFTDKVRYIYTKQLEEADVVVVNKQDLLNPEESGLLSDALAERFPHAMLMKMSAREGEGLEAWFQVVSGQLQSTRPIMEVDYRRYGEGEALLGWLNATVQCRSDADWEGNDWVRSLGESLQKNLQAAGIEVAHLKMTLDPDTGLGDIAVLNLVRNDASPELSQELEAPLRKGQLIVNLRAEGAPEALEEALRHALRGMHGRVPDVKGDLDHVEAFRPGQPKPVYREEGPAGIG